MTEQSDLVTGVIRFDLSGAHWMETFGGSYPIPDETFAEAAKKIADRHLEIKVAGRLARGRLEGRCVVDLSYCICDSEWPQRNEAGETVGRTATTW